MVGVRSTKQRSAIFALLDDITEFSSARRIHDELRRR
ncbi:transcriptional repressor, partial [Rhodococcus hoagii]|nr:transcriptional repressor [Prescottella equi]